MSDPVTTRRDDNERPRFRRLDESDLRAVLGSPIERVRTKIASVLGPTERRFIAHSPYLLMATSDDGGRADCSPRGDQPGFVRVIDDSTLAIPDRWGNKLTDSMSNLMSNSAIGMLFLVPGLTETLRVNGTAYVTDDLVLRQGSIESGKVPDVMVIVDISEVYLHCGKSIIRSKLWTDRHGELADALRLNRHVEALQFVANGANLDLGELVKDIEDEYTNKLY